MSARPWRPTGRRHSLGSGGQPGLAGTAHGTRPVPVPSGRGVRLARAWRRPRHGLPGLASAPQPRGARTGTDDRHTHPGVVDPAVGTRPGLRPTAAARGRRPRRVPVTSHHPAAGGSREGSAGPAREAALSPQKARSHTPACSVRRLCQARLRHRGEQYTAETERSTPTVQLPPHSGQTAVRPDATASARRPALRCRRQWRERHRGEQNTASAFVPGHNGPPQQRHSRGPGSSAPTATSLSRTTPSLPMTAPYGRTPRSCGRPLVRCRTARAGPQGAKRRPWTCRAVAGTARQVCSGPVAAERADGHPAVGQHGRPDVRGMWLCQPMTLS